MKIAITCKHYAMNHGNVILTIILKTNFLLRKRQDALLEAFPCLLYKSAVYPITIANRVKPMSLLF